MRKYIITLFCLLSICNYVYSWQSDTEFINNLNNTGYFADVQSLTYNDYTEYVPFQEYSMFETYAEGPPVDPSEPGKTVPVPGGIYTLLICLIGYSIIKNRKRFSFKMK